MTATEDHGSITRLIVGVDGSENSTTAAKFAASLASDTGAHVVAVHGVGLLDRFAGRATPVIAHGHRDAIEAEFRSVWCAPLAGLDFDGVLVDGNPAAALLRTANQPGDVIVVGRRGRGGFAELALGSTSSQVVQHATVPVLVIPVHTQALTETNAAP